MFSKLFFYLFTGAQMTTVLVGAVTLIMGLAIVFVVGILAAKSFLARAKERGVDILDGISPEELAELRRLLQEVRQSELRLSLRQKLAAAQSVDAQPQPAPQHKASA